MQRFLGVILAMGVMAVDSWGADPPTAENIAAAKAFRSAIDASLRAEKQAKSTSEQRVALTELARVGKETLSSERLTPSQKAVLVEPVRARLKASKLAQDTVAAVERRPRSVRVPADRDGVLAQPGGGAAGAEPKPADQGEDLADLIQEVISPTTWERNGGLGVIKFFPIGHALVVRAPGEVHGDLADVLQQFPGR